MLSSGPDTSSPPQAARQAQSAARHTHKNFFMANRPLFVVFSIIRQNGGFVKGKSIACFLHSFPTHFAYREEKLTEQATKNNDRGKKPNIKPSQGCRKSSAASKAS